MTPDFFAALRAGLSGRSRRSLREERRAAVLVPIVDDGGPSRLILTRRTEDLPTHQGQVAFPGGHVRSGEEDPKMTALREAEEEIDLRSDRVDVVGLLDDFYTWDRSIAVTPVVGRLAGNQELRPHSREVARIFTIPVEELLRPERWRSEMEPSPWGRRRLWFFEHEGETLWGLSARIVLQLLDLSTLGCPVEISRDP